MSFDTRHGELEERILSLLSSGPKRALELKDLLEKENIKVDFSEIVRCLISLRERKLIETVKDEFFDETRPWTTSLWKLVEKKTVRPEEERPAISLVVSGALMEDAGDVVEGALSFFEALGEIVYTARRELNIAAPYIDPAFTGIMVNYRSHLRRLSELRVLTEFRKENVVSLERLKNTILPNLKYRVIGRYSLVRHSGGSVRAKVRGIHLKILVSENAALIGSFNMTEVHFLSNYDVAVLIRGELASAVLRLFLKMWDLAREPEVSVLEG
ncbi:MAG: phospholipase D-like domain-containing protein [Thermofilum sp.]|jgi:hypothetical protein|nr:phospholipase D-like domain-containing protein [Thermofilum sp.]